MNDLQTAPPMDDLVRPLGATMLIEEPGSAFDLLDPSERSALLDRAYDEYCDLTEAGLRVDPSEYCERFPAFRTSLARLLGAHQRLEDSAVVAEIPITWPDPGEEFLGYNLTRVLGQGAFARVYLARERAVGNRLVVLKLSAGTCREAHTLGQLRHPNVVPILSAQYDASTRISAVCMPFLGSTTLLDILDFFSACGRTPRDGRELLAAAADKRWSADNTAPPPAALSSGSHFDAVVHIVERLADALRVVHDNGLLHRDLKPSNVLLTPNGVPVLIDFNLATETDTTSRRLGGTLPYMPPEQLRAMGGLAELPAGDARGDLYALGVIAYELLTGAHPFGPVPVKLSHLDARDFLLPRIDAGPRPLRERNPQIDPRLESLVLRCISSDPAERPASAEELLAEIRRYRSPVRRVVRWTRSHLRLLTAVAVLAAVPTGFGIAAFVRMPPAAVVLSKTGDDEFRAGNYAKAVTAFTKALEADPDRPELHYKRGRANQMQNKFEEAITDFKAANPETNAKAAACLGACLAKLPNHLHAAAIEAYGAAIRNGLATPEVFAAKAHSHYMVMGKAAEAIQCATQALNLDPTLVAARYTRARATYRLAKTDKTINRLSALDDLRAIFAVNRGTAAHYQLAACVCAAALESNPGPANADLDAMGLEFARQCALRGGRLDTCPLSSRWAKELGVAVGAPVPALPGDDGFVDPLARKLE